MNPNKIYDFITCKYEGCGKIFKNPVQLSCRNIICKEHIGQFHQESSKCQFCQEEHSNIDDNYEIDSTMQKFLDLNAHLIDEHHELKICLDEMEKYRSRFKSIFENPEEHLDKWINYHKKKIKIQHKELMKYSEKLSSQHLHQLDLLHQKCKNDLNQRISQFETNEILSEDSSKYEDLFRTKTSKNSLKNSILNVQKSIENFKKCINELSNIIVLNKMIRFQDNNLKLAFNFEIIDKVEENLKNSKEKSRPEQEQYASINNQPRQVAKRTRQQEYVGNGNGVKLSEISYINKAFEDYENNEKTIEILYDLCFSTSKESKDIISKIELLKSFNGFAFEAGSKLFEMKMNSLKEINHKKDLKNLCNFLRIEYSCTKDDVTEKIMQYLLKPKEIQENSISETKNPKRPKSSHLTTEKDITISPCRIKKYPGNDEAELIDLALD